MDHQQIDQQVQTILDQVRHLIVAKASASLQSMAHVGLILALQKEFAVSIPPADVIELTSVKNIIGLYT